MDYSGLDDTVILRLITARDAGALSALYDRYSRLVFGVALNTVGDDHQAQEITQDVFLRVWDKASTFDSGQGKLPTWLASIARNRAIDVYRKNNVRPEGHAVSWAEAETFDLPDDADVEREAGLALQKVRVRRALAQLPEEQRHALALAFFQGLSHQEIANHLAEPLGTINTRIRLAMQKLRQELATEND